VRPAGSFLRLVEQREIEIECTRYINELRWIWKCQPSAIAFVTCDGGNLAPLGDLKQLSD
jgi:hypothetical protein